MSWANRVGSKSIPVVLLPSREEKSRLKIIVKALQMEHKVQQNEAQAMVELKKVHPVFGTRKLRKRNDIELRMIPVLTAILPFIPKELWMLIVQYVPSEVKMDAKFPDQPVGFTFLGFNYGIHQHITRCGYWHGNRNCGHQKQKYDVSEHKDCWNVLAYQVPEQPICNITNKDVGHDIEEQFWSCSSIVVFRAKNSEFGPGNKRWYHKIVECYMLLRDDSFAMDYLSRTIIDVDTKERFPDYRKQKIEFDDFTDIPRLMID